MGMKLKIGGNVVFDGAFDCMNGFTRRDACAVANAKNMRVDGLGRLAPPHVQNHVCSFAAHTGQRLQGGAGIGDNAAVVVHEDLAQLDHVLGFLAKQPDGFDVIGQPVNAKVEHFLRRVSDLKQRTRGFVHANVGRLRAQTPRLYIVT